MQNAASRGQYAQYARAYSRELARVQGVYGVSEDDATAIMTYQSHMETMIANARFDRVTPPHMWPVKPRVLEEWEAAQHAFNMRPVSGLSLRGHPRTR